MTCIWCGGYLPLPETEGEETFCTQCGKGYRFLDVVETWFRPEPIWWRYVPV
jgi:hypothetical protein